MRPAASIIDPLIGLPILDPPEGEDGLFELPLRGIADRKQAASSESFTMNESFKGVLQ